MDCTLTPFGARLMRSWVSRPLTDRALILQRLDALDELAGRVGGGTGGLPAPAVWDPLLRWAASQGRRTWEAGSAPPRLLNPLLDKHAPAAGTAASLPEVLRRLPDLERGITRIFHRTASPSELVVVLQALSKVRAAPPAAAGIGAWPGASQRDAQPASLLVPTNPARRAHCAHCTLHAARCTLHACYLPASRCPPTHCAHPARLLHAARPLPTCCLPSPPGHASGGRQAGPAAGP
jgi:hypothetical protein